MRELVAILIAIGVGLPALAGAEVMDLGRPVPQRSKTRADEAPPPPPKKIIFEDGDPVVGQLPAGDAAEVRSRNKRDFPNLIKLRGSFVHEMLKSAENF